MRIIMRVKSTGSHNFSLVSPLISCELKPWACAEKTEATSSMNIGCLRHKTFPMTQRVYSIWLEMERNRIKHAGVPTFPMSQSGLRTLAHKTWQYQGQTSEFWKSASPDSKDQNLSMAYLISLFLICVSSAQMVSLNHPVHARASFLHLSACVKTQNAFD